MKRYLIAFLFIFVPLYMFSQAPSRNYGEYKYSHSINQNGNVVEGNGFPRIMPIVVTTNFGFVQSSASYMYMGFGGVWLNSATFSWAGFQNGWYVYTYRMGTAYSYFLISKDLSVIRIQENYHNGITNEYVRCDPNEKMNNAPTY